MTFARFTQEGQQAVIRSCRARPGNPREFFQTARQSSVPDLPEFWYQRKGERFHLRDPDHKSGKLTIWPSGCRLTGNDFQVADKNGTNTGRHARA